MYLAFDNPRTSQHDTVRMDGALKTALGRHIVVAWNSSRPAARSLNDEIPLIERFPPTDRFNRTLFIVEPMEEREVPLNLSEALEKLTVKLLVTVRVLVPPEV